MKINDVLKRLTN